MGRNTMYSVKNRSASVVVYRIPELNVRREWAAGEVKRISFNELEKLSYIPGGRELMANFLQVADETVTDSLGITDRTPEYDMSEQQIADLILNGSQDAFLDALDYAPIGVVDLIKKFSVTLPITDYNKRRALLEKTGFDVDKAIANNRAEREATEVATAKSGGEKKATVEAKPAERRTTVNYKIIDKSSTK